MAGAVVEKEKKKKDVRKQVNEWLAFIMEKGKSGAAREHVSPAAMADYEQIGREARRERIGVVPAKRDLFGENVFKKVKGEEERPITGSMTRHGMNRAVDLGETFELAQDGKDLRKRLREWAGR